MGKLKLLIGFDMLRISITEYFCRTFKVCFNLLK